MNFREFLEETANCRYRPKDARFNETFDHLYELMDDIIQLPGYDASKTTHRFLAGRFGDRKKIERTLELYDSLSKHEGEQLVRRYGPDATAGIPLSGVEEAGSFLRAFQSSRNFTYDELRERWQVRFRSTFGEEGRFLFVQNSLLKMAIGDGQMYHAEQSLAPFTKNYAAVPDGEKDTALAALADFYLLRTDPLQLVGVSGRDRLGTDALKLVLMSGNKHLPDNVERLKRPESLDSRFDFGENSHIELFNRRDEIRGIRDDVDKGIRNYWDCLLDMAFWGDGLREFVDLPPEQLHPVYEALQHSEPHIGDESHGPRIQFEQGFNESLKRGTVVPWAKAIVKHFREDSVGGGNYRVLEGGMAG